MNFISLFAGIGGFDLGFEQAGLTCAAQVEIDKAARSVLQRHWPDVPKFEDVRGVGAHNLPKVDVICGGFPCQDLSVAGLRAGFEGNRSSLFFEMVRITDECRPAFLVWENVPGLLTSRGGADFWRVLHELDSIGYCGAWTMLDAQYFGLAQRRRRIFGVFAQSDIGAARCAQILTLGDRLRWHSQKGKEQRPNIASQLTRSFGAGGADDNDAQAGLLIIQEQGGFGMRTFEDITPTLQSEGGTHQGGASRLPMIALCNRGHVDTVAETLRSDSHGALPMVFGMMPRRSQFEAGDKAPTLNTGGGGMGMPAVAFHEYQGDRIIDENNVWPTLPAQGANNGGGAGARLHQHGANVRRLTPTECERLQGFPDGWTDNQADSARYRQLGNAVAVPVVQWIGERLRQTHLPVQGEGLGVTP